MTPKRILLAMTIGPLPLQANNAEATNPHREKLGGLEYAHLLAGWLMYNYDVPPSMPWVLDPINSTQPLRAVGITGCFHH